MNSNTQHQDIEKYSSAFTLSDMEIFIFPDLLYSLVLANIMSPIIWRWKNDPWFEGIDKKSFNYKVNRVKQYIMERTVFNLDLETWGLTSKEKEQIIRSSGADVTKCMRCGKCSATCPAYDEMEYHPHQFVAMVDNNEIEPLLNSESLYKCLSCFACVERCPRGVEPAKLVEAIRLIAIRRQGANHMTANDVPALLDADIPQQALVSAFRKYTK